MAEKLSEQVKITCSKSLKLWLESEGRKLNMEPSVYARKLCEDARADRKHREIVERFEDVGEKLTEFSERLSEMTEGMYAQGKWLTGDLKKTLDLILTKLKV